MAIIATNKKAKFDYDLIETYEGGLALKGYEVKSAKLGNVSLKGAFISIKNNELWLKGARISEYKMSNITDYDPHRDRKVLVKKREIRHLIGKTKEKGLTIVPIQLYTKGNLIKIEFALARGKKKYEKRESIKKRELEKRISESFKKRQQLRG